MPERGDKFRREREEVNSFWWLPHASSLFTFSEGLALEIMKGRLRLESDAYCNALKNDESLLSANTLALEPEDWRSTAAGEFWS